MIRPHPQGGRCYYCGDAESTEWHVVTDMDTGRKVIICHFCFNT